MTITAPLGLFMNVKNGYSPADYRVVADEFNTTVTASQSTWSPSHDPGQPFRNASNVRATVELLLPACGAARTSAVRANLDKNGCVFGLGVILTVGVDLRAVAGLVFDFYYAAYASLPRDDAEFAAARAFALWQAHVIASRRTAHDGSARESQPWRHAFHLTKLELQALSRTEFGAFGLTLVYLSCVAKPEGESKKSDFRWIAARFRELMYRMPGDFRDDDFRKAPRKSYEKEDGRVIRLSLEGDAFDSASLQEVHPLFLDDPVFRPMLDEHVEDDLLPRYAFDEADAIAAGAVSTKSMLLNASYLPASRALSVLAAVAGVLMIASLCGLPTGDVPGACLLAPPALFLLVPWTVRRGRFGSLLLPRVGAAVVVAIGSLLLFDKLLDAMIVYLRAEWWKVLITQVVCLGVVLGYLYSEARTATPDGWSGGHALGRAARAMLVMHSWAVLAAGAAWVCLDSLGLFELLEEADRIPWIPFTATLAPPAMLGGLLLQILWEDRPATASMRSRPYG